MLHQKSPERRGRMILERPALCRSSLMEIFGDDQNDQGAQPIRNGIAEKRSKMGIGVALSIEHGPEDNKAGDRQP